MRIRWTLILNAATVLVFAGVVAICIKEAYSASTTPQGTENASPHIEVGQQLPSLAKYEWHSHRRTLLLALRDGCHYCKESAPFYRRLAAFESSGEFGNVHILAIFPDDAGVVNKVLESERLSFEAVPSVDLKKLGVTGTPTAILVDQTGKVSDVWMGELNPDREKMVLGKLRSEI